ncbi:MAG: NADH-quinone oxidoreductase subunit N, partial [Acidimicrobiia bacterium]|nr:NADH-quinone oxidoreductase subunit N [Acidimicrobiia bacterium]
LGQAVAGILAVAFGFTVWQWIRVEDLEASPTPDFIAQILPFGRMIVLDQGAVFARFAVLVAAALGVAAGWRLFERLGRRGAEALALVLLATAGFMLMAASTHLMMMFLGLEVGSIALYVLAGITRERMSADEAAIKYFLLGSVASAVFVYGVALTYAGTGQLSILATRSFLASTIVTRPAVLLIGLAMLVVGLAFKISAAPFHSWAPDVYQGAPAGIVGYMAAVAKIGGFAALIRVLFTAFPSMMDEWAPLIAGIAVLSMVLGGIFALVQDDVRRLLAYSGVTHAGFILTGLLGGGSATREIWFYLAVYVLQLLGAFAVVTAVAGATGGPTPIASFAGLGRRHPAQALGFTTLLLGMSGLPLTSGFIAKFGVFRSAWEGGFEWVVVVAVLASVVGFAFYLRVIVAMYMQDGEENFESTRPGRAVVAITALATVILGLVPGPLLDLAANALPL